MNVDSSSCHGSGHDFMVRSLLLYFFAKQLHSTSSPERLKHLCKKAPTSKETNKTSNKKPQKPSCKVPSDHVQDPSVTDVFRRGNAICWYRITPCPLGATLLAAGKKFWVFRG